MGQIKDWAMHRVEELYILGYEISEICLEMNVDADFVRATLDIKEDE